MICSASLMGKRGPTCRDPRVNAMAQDFEHGEDHLVKILSFGVRKGAAEVSAGRRSAESTRARYVRLRNVVSGVLARPRMAEPLMGGR